MKNNSVTESSSSESVKRILYTHWPMILQVELCALLHDIGKLSKSFLDYRKSWHADPRGWDSDNDPHCKEFLKKDPLLKDALQDLFSKDVSKPDPENLGLGPFSVESAVHEHCKKEASSKLIQYLRAADGVDAAQDRNNPLFSAEQNDRSQPPEAQDNIVFKSNVYGYEGMETFIDAGAVEAEREKLYGRLSECLEEYYRELTPASVHSLPQNHKSEMLNPLILLNPAQNREWGSKRLQQIWKTRGEIFQSIQDAFSVTVSDTTRPANDTTLWEHSYAVATITKVILAHRIIYGKDLDECKKVFFGILGIGWDGLRFISRGHKIGDIVAREGLLAKIREEIRLIIEYKVPIGNFIYEDLNGIYFLVPATQQPPWIKEDDLCPEEGKGKYLDLLGELKDKILEKTAELSYGELCPHVSLPGGTTFVTSILNSIREIKKEARLPFTGDCHSAVKILQDNFQKKPDSVICSVCQLRPVKGMKRYSTICGPCLTRRKEAQKKARKTYAHGQTGQAPPDTLFIEEISDSNSRIALIVGHFGLDNWLGGSFVRSLFISPVQAMCNEVKDLGNTVQCKIEELKKQHFLKKKYPDSWADYNYERIKKEVSLCLRCSKGDCSAEERKYAENVLFLYDRRKATLDKGIAERWDLFLQAAKKEHPEPKISDDDLLINILLAKTPTPSTILDTWRTTEAFFNTLVSKDMKDGGERFWKFLKKKARTVIQVRETPSERLFEGAVYQGRINGKRLDLVWSGGKRFWVINSSRHDEWKGKVVKITASDIERAFKEPLKMEIEDVDSEPYLPFRTITTTPVLFMALVPANKAVAATRFISRQYYKRFGKVIGRLPLSIGNIFFKEKTPMFVVLDAARRMVKNFEALSQGKDAEAFLVTDAPSPLEGQVSNTMAFKLTSTRDQRSINWKVPVSLGDCSRDLFHPYIVLDNQQQDSCGPLVGQRQSFLPAIDGSAVHVADVQKGNRVRVYPNYYDFEFLDVTTRRFDLTMAEGHQRRIDPSTGREGTKPYLLEQLPGIQALWAKLCSLPGLTDTRLRNIQVLLETKRLEWDHGSGTRSRPYEELVTSILQKEFRYAQEDQDFAFFKETVLDGLWFDCLELYLKILKKRVKEKDNA